MVIDMSQPGVDGEDNIKADQGRCRKKDRHTWVPLQGALAKVFNGCALREICILKILRVGITIMLGVAGHSRDA